jgi:hypothetical protein
MLLFTAVVVRNIANEGREVFILFIITQRKFKFNYSIVISSGRSFL